MNTISGSKRYHVPNGNVQRENKFHEDLFRMRRVTVNFDVKSLKMFKVLRPTHTDAVRCASKPSAAIIFYVLTDTGGSHTALHAAVLFPAQPAKVFVFPERTAVFFKLFMDSSVPECSDYQQDPVFQITNWNYTIAIGKTFCLSTHIAAVCQPLGMFGDNFLYVKSHTRRCWRILKYFSRITLGSCCIGNLVVCQVVWL